MFDNNQYCRDWVGILPQNQQPQQQVLEPFHIIKYKIREGTGAYVKAGMNIICYVNIFLIDGTQIITCNGNKTTRFLLGRNRLIKGLQIGLKKVQKHEKLRLIISSQYAYGQQQSETLLIPPNSKLIFQIQIIEFYRTQIESMTDIQLFYEVYYYLDKSDYLLRKKKENEGLDVLLKAYNYAKKIKYYKSNILSKILLRWGYILYHRKQYRNALTVICKIDKYDIYLEDCFRLQINILKELSQKVQLQKLMEKMYNENLHNKNIKRIVVDYYKQQKKWDLLSKLNGYNWKKDKFVQPKKEDERSRQRNFRYYY